MDPAVERLARRAAREPAFMSSVLAAYAESKQLDDIAIAAALGCAPAQLALLRLCLRPRETPAQFRQDVAAIAAHAGVNAAKLAEVIRYADTLAAFRAVAGPRGALLAARDRPANYTIDGANSQGPIAGTDTDAHALDLAAPTGPEAPLPESGEP